LPTIDGFNKYKDYGVIPSILDQFNHLYLQQNWKAMWDLVKDNMELPRCEKSEILNLNGKKSNGVNEVARPIWIIRCYKPERVKKVEEKV